MNYTENCLQLPHWQHHEVLCTYTQINMLQQPYFEIQLRNLFRQGIWSRSCEVFPTCSGTSLLLCCLSSAFLSLFLLWLPQYNDETCKLSIYKTSILSAPGLYQLEGTPRVGSKNLRCANSAFFSSLATGWNWNTDMCWQRSWNKTESCSVIFIYLDHELAVWLHALGTFVVTVWICWESWHSLHGSCPLRN